MTPRFDLVGIVVNDMAKALAFYRRLGLDIPAEADSEPHVECALPGGVRLAWDDAGMIQEIDPAWTPTTSGPPIALGFLCAGPSEVDKVYADMVGAGYDGHKEPWDAFWGQRYAVLHDPDGNGVDLFAPLETAAAA
jgi:catechol 2,3-dioxygenase-like lactoylglutathione lyase family enzyme